MYQVPKSYLEDTDTYKGLTWYLEEKYQVITRYISDTPGVYLISTQQGAHLVFFQVLLIIKLYLGTDKVPTSCLESSYWVFMCLVSTLICIRLVTGT